jgi:hypothetical protein
MTTGTGVQMRWEGYTNSYGDGGRAIIDGGATGTAYVLLTNNAAVSVTKGFIFQNNGNSSNAAGFVSSGGRQHIENCVAHDLRGFGISVTGGFTTLVECETYLCNGSNTASQAGFNLLGGSISAKRCIAHDNAGSNTSGFISTSFVSYQNCIADTNGANGFTLTGNVTAALAACDCYNNVAAGINTAISGPNHIESCNLIKNGTYGIIGVINATCGAIINCGFGAGTQANASGTITIPGMMVESGSVTYPSNVTPWVDPANGDFRINLLQAWNAGRGTFVETQSSYAGTVGYPDIGSAQFITRPSAQYGMGVI